MFPFTSITFICLNKSRKQTALQYEVNYQGFRILHLTHLDLHSTYFYLKTA